MYDETLNAIQNRLRKPDLHNILPGEALEVFETGLIHGQFQNSIAPNIVYKLPDLRLELAYLAAGLNEEAGEASGKVKKYLRGDYPLEYGDDTSIQGQNQIVKEKRDQVAYELGDCLWYLTRMANILGYSLEEIMQMNINKLASRAARDQIKGDGDNR